MAKYELTRETWTFGEQTLYRIRARRDFSNVRAGDLGGWVAGPDNLSQRGDCWVYDNASMSGDARMSDNASMSGDAHMYGNAIVSGNASMSGDARMSGNARMYGNASMSGNARMSGHATLSGNALVESPQHVMTIGPIGSRDDHLTFYRTAGGDGEIHTGCFTGTIVQFEAAVKETHAGTAFEAEYLALVQLMYIRELTWSGSPK